MSADDAQKTHKPTPKRISEFRKRGEIANSRDLTSIAALFGGALGGMLFWSQGRVALAELTRSAMTTADGVEQPQLASAAVHTFAVTLAPVCAGALVGCIIAGGLQLGWPPALKKPSFDLGRVFGGASLGQMFAPKAAATRTLLAAAKVVMVGAVVWFAVRHEVGAIAGGGSDAATLQERLASAVVRLSMHALLALAALAVIDYVIQRRRLGAKMKMSSDELRRESRERDGDPQVRGRRRRRMRELAQRRLVAAVQSSDVVVVNPTEYAVALRYAADDGGAPRVTAKGRGPVAARMREVARQAGIPILRRPPLARLLHKLVPEGREIPAATYQAVAEILAYVYRLRGRRA